MGGSWCGERVGWFRWCVVGGSWEVIERVGFWAWGGVRGFGDLWGGGDWVWVAYLKLEWAVCACRLPKTILLINGDLSEGTGTRDLTSVWL